MAEYHNAEMLEASAYDEAFQGFKQHSTGLRQSTELVALDLLQKSHPDFHVTSIHPLGCDFKGYAKAGHAIMTKEVNDNIFAATHIYQAPEPRVEKDPGSVSERVRFGRWIYTWADKDYLLYEMEASHNRGSLQAMFILSHRTENDEPHAAADKLLMAVGAWSAQLHEEIWVFDEGCWTKSHELYESVRESSWDEVILNQDMKANLIQDVHGFFDNKELYKKLAVPWKRGLILHGVPGNGKTITIKALISTLYKRKEPVPSLYVKSFDAQQGRNGGIRNIFAHARQMAPCLLIFEDLDSLVTDKTRAYFLNEVDGLESNDGILMIGSTNHLGLLDPAISKRPSRFDRKYQFKIPDEDERNAYCQYWQKKLSSESGIDFPAESCSVIAKLTEGFSFAYMKELFVTALLMIARGNTTEVEENETPVLVRREDAVEKVSEAKVEEAPENAEESQKKRVIPEVNVPDSLKENVLLKVMRAHIMTLLDEMDSTKEADWVSSKSHVGGTFATRPSRAFGRPPPIVY